MAKYRFQPDPNFQLEIEAAALGVDPVTGRKRVGSRAVVRSRRRRFATLERVGEQIVQEAQKMADRELPSRTSSGGRNIAHPFAAPDRAGRTYARSFSSRVVKYQGRWTLIIENTHPSADDVEFGNNQNGRTRITPKGRKMLAVPLTKAGAARFKARENSPDAIARKRLHSQKSYWYNRQKELIRRRDKLLSDAESQRKKQAKLREAGFNPPDTQRIADRRRHFDESKRRALVGFARARAALGSPRQRMFVGTSDRTGKPVLFTESVRTYKGYGILRRATRKVTIRELE